MTAAAAAAASEPIALTALFEILVSRDAQPAQQCQALTTLSTVIQGTALKRALLGRPDVIRCRAGRAKRVAA